MKKLTYEEATEFQRKLKELLTLEKTYTTIKMDNIFDKSYFLPLRPTDLYFFAVNMTHIMQTSDAPIDQAFEVSLMYATLAKFEPDFRERALTQIAEALFWHHGQLMTDAVKIESEVRLNWEYVGERIASLEDRTVRRTS